MHETGIINFINFARFAARIAAPCAPAGIRFITPARAQLLIDMSKEPRPTERAARTLA